MIINSNQKGKFYSILNIPKAKMLHTGNIVP